MNSPTIREKDPRPPIRNIGILAHIDAGKTSITERVLHVAGVRPHAGNVDDGTTATDYLNIERQHGITIKTAAVRFLHRGVLFHLLDTPGHVDFSAEVDRVLRVLDGAIIVLCAVSGVQVRTGFIASGCRAHAIPRIYFINKMDRRGADFHEAVQQVAGELGEPVLPLQIPTFDGQLWNGIVDLVEMRWFPVSIEKNALESGADNSASLSAETSALGDLTDVRPLRGAITYPLADAPISERARDEAREYREKLLDRASMYDDALMAKVLEGADIAAEKIRAALRGPIYRQELTPVLCGSSFSDISSALLLEAIIDYLPDPEPRGCPEAKDLQRGVTIRLPATADAFFSAYIFKTVVGPDLDAIAWLRIWSGTIRDNARVTAIPAKKHVQIQHLYGIHGSEIEPVQTATAGEIVGARLSFMEAGGTLCAPNLQLAYESFKTPEPLVSIALEPSSLQDLPRLREALARYSLEDVSLRVHEEKETGRIVVAGQGELHLDIVIERLRKEYGLHVRAGNPQVPKVERLKKSARVEEVFEGNFGGEKLTASMTLVLENDKESDENSLLFSRGLRVSAIYEAAIHQAMETALAVGPTAGWPMRGVKSVVEAFVQPATSDKRAETAVEAAASAAFRRALEAAGSIVLVPIVQIAVEVPDAWFGPALASLQAHGARIESAEDASGIKTIVAYAPMEKLFGYATSLRSITEGRGIYQAKFDHFGNELDY